MNNLKNTLINKIADLNLGYLEEADDMTTAELESLYYDLSAAQEAGKMNLETDEGIKNLEAIVEKYTSVSASDWVDYLLQINAIESCQEYADWVLSIPLPEVSQELANQPCDTPTAEELYDWAEAQSNHEIE